MKFLADMGVSRGVTDWLRSEGHDAIHLNEQGLKHLPDAKVFDKAANESRILLTFDLDFGEILAMSGDSIISVVLFRLNNTTTKFVIRRLRAVLQDAAEALKAGAIVVVEDGRHRIRRLPLGK
jgi:predicted nuclease of predicted toxin-antitoxin system